MSYNPRSHSAWHRVIRNPTFQHPTLGVFGKEGIHHIIINNSYYIYYI